MVNFDINDTVRGLDSNSSLGDLIEGAIKVAAVIGNANQDYRNRKLNQKKDIAQMHYGLGDYAGKTSADRNSQLMYGFGSFHDRNNTSAERIASMHYGPGGAYDRGIAGEDRRTAVMKPYYEGAGQHSAAQANALNQGTDIAKYTWENFSKPEAELKKKFVPGLMQGMYDAKTTQNTILSNPNNMLNLLRLQYGVGNRSFVDPGSSVTGNNSGVAVPTSPQRPNMFTPRWTIDSAQTK